ncbi:MAG: hypothetical protein NXH75_07520 [Halobacteriovoraceae bacterium]|nr:hypothetical protein [Halobacteriovoraceae bacterium]
MRWLPLLILSLFVSCSSPEDTNYSFRCHVIRAGIDIGSGSTKFLLAKIDKCKRSLIGVLKEENIAIKFKESLHLNKDRISENLLGKAKSAITNFMVTHNVSTGQIRGVATEVFREAKNGDVVINRLARETGVSLKIIDQKKEAELGFWAVIGMTGKQPNDILVWDIGGGSMQMTVERKGHLFSYLGKLASVSFKNYVLKEKSLKRGSPNPIGSYSGVQSYNYAYSFAQKEVDIEIQQEAKRREVIGIGGVHYYSVRMQLNRKPNSPYSLYELLRESNKRVNWSDSKFSGLYKETEASNLLLVGGFMKALGIETVLPLKVNLATGILFDDTLW